MNPVSAPAFPAPAAAAVRARDMTREDVARALAAERPGPQDLLALLSPAAAERLEDLAQRARRLTLQHFGRAVQLYSPLYLSNHCLNACRYCGFNVEARVARRTLTPAEVESEARALAATGIRHVLALTGEHPARAPLAYVEACVRLLARHFLTVGLDIFACRREEYARLVDAGARQLTLYQETYDPQRYAELHPRGPKRNYAFRLDAPDRACLAGFRGVNLGILLGLSEWVGDAYALGLHARRLLECHPDVEVGVSLPRLRPHAGCRTAARPVDDAALVQILTALRIFLPRLGITLSTREPERLRHHLLPLGVTRLSAGSTTAVGGRTLGADAAEQFEIADHRPVAEVHAALRRQGYQPVYTDWHTL